MLEVNVSMITLVQSSSRVDAVYIFHLLNKPNDFLGVCSIKFIAKKYMFSSLLISQHAWPTVNDCEGFSVPLK